MASRCIQLVKHEAQLIIELWLQSLGENVGMRTASVLPPTVKCTQWMLFNENTRATPIHLWNTACHGADPSGFAAPPRLRSLEESCSLRAATAHVVSNNDEREALGITAHS